MRSKEDYSVVARNSDETGEELCNFPMQQDAIPNSHFTSSNARSRQDWTMKINDRKKTGFEIWVYRHIMLRISCTKYGTNTSILKELLNRLLNY